MSLVLAISGAVVNCVAYPHQKQQALVMKRTATASSSLADKVLDLAAECFDASTLDALAKLRLDSKLAARVNRLADKANEGMLTPRERSEYQAYIKTSELLGLIQLRARLKLRLSIPAE